MGKLFLDGIYDDKSSSPSTLRIRLMNPSDKAQLFVDLKGIMVGDPSFSAQNKWGTIINDLSNLQDFSSLIGSDSMFSWINASTMCWKGTAPLSIGIEFYLINYKKDLGLEEKLKKLIKLASIAADPSASNTSQNFKVMVHGGYAADVLDSNKSAFWTANVQENGLGVLSDSGLESVASGLYNNTGHAKSSISLKFGNKSEISNLLLSKINITESTVEVANQDGTNMKPLYYRVQASFIGVRPLLTKDVDAMFDF